MSEELGISRIAVSLPESLLNTFDDVLEVRNYASRSEGIRDAVRMYVTHNDWVSQTEGENLAVISLVYSPDQQNLASQVTELERKNREIIKISLISDMSDAKRLGILLLRGESIRLREIFQQIQGIKGMAFAKMSVISCRT